MFELQGKYNSCKVFTDDCENDCISQLLTLLNQESSSGCQIRIMPDCHAGAGCVIGTTMTLTDRVTPNLVGADIGCGVLVVRLKEKSVDLPALDAVIHEKIPSGFKIHSEAVADSNVEDLRCAKSVDLNRAALSLGSLGGGNHFIEVDRDEEDALYLVIHCGSRHLGMEVCSFYQEAAYNQMKESQVGSLSQMSKDLAARLKAEGRQRDIEKQLKALKERYNKTEVSVPRDLAFVSGGLFDDYIHDMKLVQEHASINRKTIARIILIAMNLHQEDYFETVHNYVDTEAMILRKGAVSAGKGETLIIPMNMRDGSLLCTGKGNPDWNCSAPHGAGREMSRSMAKELIPLSEYQESMAGIYTTCVGTSTIDESPQAYKPMEEVMENMEDTVSVDHLLKPVYNFKASE